MRRDTIVRTLLISAMLLAAGCAPVVSKGLRNQVAEGITFGSVFETPEAFRGKILIWGGVIIETKNLREGTVIEVLQKPLDFVGQPKEVDRTGGRFLALYEGFLDPVVYGEGREITVAGEVKGEKVKPLDEIAYTYPVLSVNEIYLWPERNPEVYSPYLYFYYPYFPPDHWYRHRHHHVRPETRRRYVR